MPNEKICKNCSKGKCIFGEKIGECSAIMTCPCECNGGSMYGEKTSFSPRGKK